MRKGIKTLAMWLIIGVIFIVVLSSIIENSDSRLKYSELVTHINNEHKRIRSFFISKAPYGIRKPGSQ